MQFGFHEDARTCVNDVIAGHFLKRFTTSILQKVPIDAIKSSFVITTVNGFLTEIPALCLPRTGLEHKNILSVEE